MPFKVKQDIWTICWSTISHILPIIHHILLILKNKKIHGVFYIWWTSSGYWVIKAHMSVSAGYEAIVALREYTWHDNDVIMSAMASLITGVLIVYSTVFFKAQMNEKHQSSASLAFVRGIHRWPVNTPHSNAENVSIWWRQNEFDFI